MVAEDGSYGLKPDWCRINVFLPINSAVEMQAALVAIEFLRNEYEGITHSSLRPHTFMGYWWDKDDNDPNDQGKFVEDKICWVTLDLPYAIGNTDLDDDIFLINLEILRIYNQQFSRKEKIIWIITHASWKSP